jgi:hypothetical protein
MDMLYWQSLATDYDTAARDAFGRSVDRDALVLAMSVAEHETNNGRAWPGSNNFGAVQLRGLNAAEFAAFQAGTLKAGDYNADRSGVLHVDTHPPGVPYPVWFAAFPTRVLGVAYFLKALWRLSAGACEAPDASAATVALAMYCHHYFEGRHVDERPWVAVRPVPLSPDEQLNVNEYAGAVSACRDTIIAGLGGWEQAQPSSDTTVAPEDVDPHPDITAPTGVPS